MKKILIIAGLGLALTGCAVVPYDGTTVVHTEYKRPRYINDYSVVNRYYDPYPTYGYGTVYSPYVYPSVQFNYRHHSNRNDYRHYPRRYDGNNQHHRRPDGQPHIRPNREHRQR